LDTVDLESLLASGVDDIAHMVEDNLTSAQAARVVARRVFWIPTLELWYGVQQANPGSRVHQNTINNLRRFVEAGGANLVAMGTDYAGYASQFDLGMPLRELLWMQEAGMTSMQIIQAATQKAAVVCNQGDSLGTLETGKIADILVVDGNPLENLQALSQIVLILHQGVIIRNTLSMENPHTIFFPMAEVKTD
jgi:imidazolonepropionase-like amidohydrolase